MDVAIDIKQKNKLIYREAKKFIEEYMVSIGLKKERLKDYLNDNRDNNSINDIAGSLFFSLSNRHMMTSVIGFEKREKEIKKILLDYDPKNILKKYADAEELLTTFKTTFGLTNVDSPHSLWRIFSKGIISASHFLSTFNSKEEFDRFVKTFSKHKDALPMLLSKEIDGAGFALACDFLKEQGFREYGKPDVHLTEIFYKLGLSETKNDYEVHKKLIKMSEYVGEDPYTVDKVFWLIGSRNFYLDDIWNRGKNNRAEFIEIVRKKLK